MMKSYTSSFDCQRSIAGKLATFTFMMLIALVNASAAEVYQPVGAPADPEVTARWNFYRSYAEATGLLKQLAAAHPEICRLESVGQSHDGHELWVMTITSQTDTAEAESRKPGFWIDGGIHANEIQAVDVVLYTAWYLCELHGRNEYVDRLLRERVFYLMPMMSPDSRVAHMEEPNTTNWPRTGQVPVDDDRDGLVDEDPPEDLNGDGSLTYMYVRDPNGDIKRHPRFRNAMVDIEPHERNLPGLERYTFLGLEGYDNDGDGRVNEDGDGYYDPNRDWAWQWQPKYVQFGAHRYPFSIPSNRQVAQFIMAHPNIAGAQSYHNTGGMILRGPGAKDDRWPAEDIAVYDKLGKHGERMLPGYRYMNTAKELYEVWGGGHDWLYAMHGAFAFTNELNTPYNLFHQKRKKGDWIGPALQQHEFSELLVQGAGFAPLEEVDHPQYGKVLVGGKTKNWGRQPPSFMIEEELHRNMAFTLYHADQGPLVEISTLSVEPFGNSRRQVTATIVNRRICPTRTRFDLDHKVTPPDRVELTGGKAIAAMTSERIVFDQPQIAQIDGSFNQVRVDRIGAQKAKYLRWIIDGDGPVTVTVRSVKGGTVSKRSDEMDNG